MLFDLLVQFCKSFQQFLIFFWIENADGSHMANIYSCNLRSFKRNISPGMVRQ